MAQARTSKQRKPNNGANVGYEAELWQMADALRGSMDAAEYKQVVLGLIFLKYISGCVRGAARKARSREGARRWQFGKPPIGDANFAWAQHFIHHSRGLIER